MFWEEARKRVIKTIIDIDNRSVYPMLKGENLAEYLKDLAVIHPNEYNVVITKKTQTVMETLEVLGELSQMVKRKQNYFLLYEEYVRYFLGSKVSQEPCLCYVRDNGLLRESDLRDKNGMIDYRPFLNALGIDENMYKREEDYSPSLYRKKIEKIKVTGIQEKN